MKRGTTPLSRWKWLTEELAIAMPLSPSKSEWLMTLYEHEVRTLSRKTGITCRSFNYKGDNLTYLVQKYGEVQLNILVNPDDYRFIYVNEGEDRPLVQLTEEFVTETTPAYSFAQKAVRIKEETSQIAEAPAKTRFQKDVQNASHDSSSKATRKKLSKAEANRAVADQAKEAQAVRRAIDNPVKATPGDGEMGTNLKYPASFEEVAALPMLNRVSGKEQT